MHEPPMRVSYIHNTTYSKKVYWLKNCLNDFLTDWQSKRTLTYVKTYVKTVSSFTAFFFPYVLTLYLLLWFKLLLKFYIFDTAEANSRSLRPHPTKWPLGGVDPGAATPVSSPYSDLRNLTLEYNYKVDSVGPLVRREFGWTTLCYMILRPESDVQVQSFTSPELGSSEGSPETPRPVVRPGTMFTPGGQQLRESGSEQFLQHSLLYYSV